MNTDQEHVASYYDQNAVQEWERSSRHRTEFAVTWRALKAHLPPPPARLLDCGGGPGHFAIGLAQQGYQVTLFDLSTGNLALAREKAAESTIPLEAFELGSATDLGRFSPESFDAVLLMGPLYHLLAKEDRETALQQARRVLKPGGVLVATFISRYAALRDAAAYYPEDLLKKRTVYQALLQTGQLPPSADSKGGFVAYLAHPDEAEQLVCSQGFELRQSLALEGVASGHEEKVNTLQGEAWETWLDMNYQAAQDACLRGAADHLLVVAERSLWRAVLGRVVTQIEQAGIPYKIVGGTCAALHGVPVPVHDIDLETTPEGAERIAGQIVPSLDGLVTLPVAWRESEKYRSHYGQAVVEGLKFDLMADLEWRMPNGWLPVSSATECTVDLDGQGIKTAWLEEEAASYLRRGRLERASVCLPYCQADKLGSVMFKNSGLSSR